MPVSRKGSLCFASCLLGTLLGLSSLARGQEPAPPKTPPEGTTKRELPAVRFQMPPVIDGDLSDPVWQIAAKTTGFTDALYGNLVKDQTVVYMGYDDANIYVGFYAHDSDPKGIVARETKRGTQFQGEDYVAFTIDPFRTRRFRDRSFFLVNPLGTQFARLGGGRATKLEWEGEWKAAAKVVSDGWVVEMAIPWKILNYPLVRTPITTGLNFNRFHERTNVNAWWSNIGPTEFYELEGNWVGVQLPPYRPQVSYLPYVTSGWEENRGVRFRTGMDVRAALTPSLTGVGTILPDFETVEGAVEGIDFSYGERFVPDRRPFFLEGSDIYSSGGVAGNFYDSGRIPNFDTGINVYGKLNPRDAVGVLSAWDVGHFNDWILRHRHELGSTSSVDWALINRDDTSVHNRVGVVGENWRKGFWGVDAAWAGSWVGEKQTGGTANASFSYNTPRWFAYLSPYYVSPGFRSDLGFIPFTDYRGADTELDYANEWRKGWLRRVHLGTFTQDSSHYSGEVFRRTRSIGGSIETRKDYSVNLQWQGGQFDQYHDHVIDINLGARVSDPFHHYGMGFEQGVRAGHSLTFLTPYAVWRFGVRFTLGVSSSFLYHTEDQYQHLVTFNYDFSPGRGIVGRIVSQTGGTNGYMAYRQSGYGGVEKWIIMGDPNAQKFTRRVMTKIVWPL